MKISRRTAFLSALAGVVCVPRLIWADPSSVADEGEARNFIESLARATIATAMDAALNNDQRRDGLRKIFDGAVDLPKIAKFVLAQRWQSATPEQQAEFLTLFEEGQILLWLQRFRSYAGETLETQQAQVDGEGMWLVDSKIVHAAGAPTVLQWRVRAGEDGRLRVVDVVANGLSMALTMRQDYAAILQSNGQNFDGLLTSLKGRNRGLEVQLSKPIPAKETSGVKSVAR